MSYHRKPAIIDEGAARREAITAALRRRRGPTSGFLARQRADNETRTDWRGQCQRCGHVRYGTLGQLREPCATCGHR